MKFHPSLQAFAPDDPRYWPIFAACQEHGLIALFHTGTSGIGARQPGGQGIRLDYAQPIRLDPVAAAHPGLTIVAAHFGWPWQMELIAIALHKTNVYIDISGWSPRRVPAEVVSELRGRLSGQFLWGSDFPFLTPERCLAEFDALDLPADVAGSGAPRQRRPDPRPRLTACPHPRLSSLAARRRRPRVRRRCRGRGHLPGRRAAAGARRRRGLRRSRAGRRS